MNFKVLLFKLIIAILASCSNRSNYLGSYVNSSRIKNYHYSSKFEFLPNNRYVFNTSFHGIKLYSFGKFEIRNSEILLTSDYIDSIFPITVVEKIDTSILGYRIEIADSNFYNNYVLCATILNGNKNDPKLCIDIVDSIKTIKDSTIGQIRSFEFDFSYGFHTQEYQVINKKSNVFTVNFNMPIEIRDFILFNKKVLKLRRRSVVVDDLKYKKISL